MSRRWLGIDVALGTRNCECCENKIKKGEVCLSFEYATGMYVTRMHICKVCLPDLAKKLADKEVKIKLRNGAEVIKTKTDSTGGIVLACWARNVNDEYITWEVNSKGDTYSGHYFSNVEDAEKDYSVRVLNYFRRK